MSYTEYLDLIERAKRTNAFYKIYTLDGVGAERAKSQRRFVYKSFELMKQMQKEFIQLEKELGESILVTDDYISLDKQKNKKLDFTCQHNPNFTSGDLISFYFINKNITDELFKEVFYKCAKAVNNTYTYHLATCPYETNNYFEGSSKLWVGYAQQYLNNCKSQRICDLKRIKNNEKEMNED